MTSVFFLESYMTLIMGAEESRKDVYVISATREGKAIKSSARRHIRWNAVAEVSVFVDNGSYGVALWEVRRKKRTRLIDSFGKPKNFDIFMCWRAAELLATVTQIPRDACRLAQEAVDRTGTAGSLSFFEGKISVSQFHDIMHKPVPRAVLWQSTLTLSDPHVYKMLVAREMEAGTIPNDKLLPPPEKMQPLSDDVPDAASVALKPYEDMLLSLARHLELDRHSSGLVRIEREAVKLINLGAHIACMPRPEVLLIMASVRASVEVVRDCLRVSPLRDDELFEKDIYQHLVNDAKKRATEKMLHWAMTMDTASGSLFRSKAEQLKLNDRERASMFDALYKKYFGLKQMVREASSRIAA